MVRSKSCREPAVSAAPARSERAVSGRGDGGAGATPPRDVDGGAADGAYVHFADEAAWKASGQRFWAASENLRGSCERWSLALVVEHWLSLVRGVAL